MRFTFDITPGRVFGCLLAAGVLLVLSVVAVYTVQVVRWLAPILTADDPTRATTYFSDPKTVALVTSIQADDLPGVRRALADGADPNATGKNGTYPLIFAARVPDAELVRALLAAGAQPGATQDKGARALDLAVSFSTADTVAALLAAGVGFDPASSEGQSLWQAAVTGGRAETVRLLARAGADINARLPRESSPPLVFAVEYEYWDTARVLLELGADVNAVNYMNHDAATVLCSNLRAAKTHPAATTSRGLPELIKAFEDQGISLPCASEIDEFRRGLSTPPPTP